MIAGLLAAAFMGMPVAAAPGPAGLVPFSKGWGWLLAAGVISGVDVAARTVTLSISGQGRLETVEGGGAWRRQTVTGAQVVHLLPATVISNAEAAPLSIVAVRPGVPATVWAAVRPDASVLGLKVVVPAASPKPPAASSVASPYALSGAVLRAFSGMLELLTAQGARRSVILTGATTIRNTTGTPASPASIAPYDVVRVEGTVNADGSVAATRIDLELGASGAPKVSGSVDQVFEEIEGLVVGGVMVPISPECYFIKAAGPGAFKQLAPGQAVTVYGVTISTGSTAIGLRARVVVGR